MLTDFYNSSHMVYSVNLQHNNNDLPTLINGFDETLHNGKTYYRTRAVEKLTGNGLKL